MVAIIDDREDVWGRCPNLVHVKPYVFFAGTNDINAPPPLMPTCPSSPLPSTPTTPRPFFGQDRGGVVPQGQPKPFKMRHLTRQPKAAQQPSSGLAKQSRSAEWKETAPRSVEKSGPLTALEKLLVEDTDSQHTQQATHAPTHSSSEAKNHVATEPVAEKSAGKETSFLAAQLKGGHPSDLVGNNSSNISNNNNNKHTGEDGKSSPKDSTSGGEGEGGMGEGEGGDEGEVGQDGKEEGVGEGGSSSSSSSSGSESDDSSSSSASASGSSAMDDTPHKGTEEKLEAGKVEGGLETRGTKDKMKHEEPENITAQEVEKRKPGVVQRCILQLFGRS